MRTWQRVVGAWLLLVPGLVLADARTGGLEASSLSVVRTNSFGFAEDLRLGYRVNIGQPGGIFLLPYAQTAISPANAQLGVGVTLGIVPGVSLTVAYAPRFNFAGRYGFQSFGSPLDDYSDQVLSDRAAAGLTYTAWQQRLVLELEVWVPLGPFVLHDVARVVRQSANLRAGDTAFYDFELDILVAAHGWTLQNFTELLWIPDGRWALGIQCSLVQAWYPDTAYRPGEPRDDPNGPTVNLGPVVSYTFDRWGSGFDVPTIFVQAGWWLRHRYRAGEEVSQAIPTVIAGFSFKIW